MMRREILFEEELYMLFRLEDPKKSFYWVDVVTPVPRKQV